MIPRNVIEFREEDELCGERKMAISFGRCYKLQTLTSDLDSMIERIGHKESYSSVSEKEIINL